VNAGQSYIRNIASKHLTVFINLADLLSKNASRLHEADAVSFSFVHVSFFSIVFMRKKEATVFSA